MQTQRKLNETQRRNSTPQNSKLNETQRKLNANFCNLIWLLMDKRKLNDPKLNETQQHKNTKLNETQRKRNANSTHTENQNSTKLNARISKTKSFFAQKNEIHVFFLKKTIFATKNWIFPKQN